MGTDYKVNRLWNLLNVRIHISSLGILVIWAIWKISERTFHLPSDLIIVTVALMITECIKLLCRPKELTVCGKDLLFTETIHMGGRLISFGTRSRSGRWMKVHYRVSAVQTLTLEQNQLEKRYDVGHITFSGNTSYEVENGFLRTTVPDTFRIYGIQNFTEFKKHFEQ